MSNLFFRKIILLSLSFYFQSLDMFGVNLSPARDKFDIYTDKYKNLVMTVSQAQKI